MGQYLDMLQPLFRSHKGQFNRIFLLFKNFFPRNQQDIRVLFGGAQKSFFPPSKKPFGNCNSVGGLHFNVKNISPLFNILFSNELNSLKMFLHHWTSPLPILLSFYVCIVIFFCRLYYKKCSPLLKGSPSPRKFGNTIVKL